MEKPQSGSGKQRAVPVVAGVLLAAVVPLLDIGQALWADEVQSFWQAGLPVGELLARTGLLDVHPPLYYLLLKAWTALAGTSDVALRLFSLLPALGTVGLVAYWLGGADDDARGNSGVSAPHVWVGIALLALSTWFAHYAIEVRSYTWLAFWATALVFSSERWAERGGALWPVILSGAAAGLTHYFGLFCVVGVNVWVFTRDGLPRARRARWALVQASVVTLVSWWLPFAFVQALDLPRQFTSHLTESVSAADVFGAFGPGLGLPATVAMGGGLLVLALCLAGFRQPLRAAPSEKTAGERRPLMLLAGLGLIGPVLAMWVVPETPLGGVHMALEPYVEAAPDFVAARASLAWAVVGTSWVLLAAGVFAPGWMRFNRRYGAAIVAAMVVALLAGAIQALRASLSLRNLLVLLPLVSVVAATGARQLGRGAWIALLLVVGLAAASLSQRHHFEIRPDFRTAAEELERTDASQVIVIPSWDQGAMTHYLHCDPGQSVRGAMSADLIGPVHDKPVDVVLTRQALEDIDSYVDAILHTLGPRWRMTVQRSLRGLELVRFSPRTDPP